MEFFAIFFREGILECRCHHETHKTAAPKRKRTAYVSNAPSEKSGLAYWFFWRKALLKCTGLPCFFLFIKEHLLKCHLTLLMLKRKGRQLSGFNKKPSIFPIKTTLASRWRDPKKPSNSHLWIRQRGALIGGFESVFFVTIEIAFFVGRPDGFFPFFEQIQMVKQQDIGSKRVFRNTLRESINSHQKITPPLFFWVT